MLKKNIKQYYKYVILYAAAFYFLPSITPDVVTPFLLLAINPTTVFGSSIYFGTQYGFSLKFLLLSPIMFLSCLFIFFSISAISYTLFYLILAAAGLGLGRIIAKFHE